MPTKSCEWVRCQEECGDPKPFFMAPSQRGREICGKKWPMLQERANNIALSILEINNLEMEHDLACAATCLWAASSRSGKVGGRYERSMVKAGVESYIVGKSQKTSKSRFCEMKDLGITVPGWQLQRMSDGSSITVKDTCPEDIKNTHQAHNQCFRCKWAKKHGGRSVVLR